MKKIIYYALILSLPILFSGCFNIGYDMTYCQAHGCNYQDAGVCGNSYDIYKNWRKAEKEAYKGYKCQQGELNE